MVKNPGLAVVWPLPATGISRSLPIFCLPRGRRVRQPCGLSRADTQQEVEKLSTNRITEKLIVTRMPNSSGTRALSMNAVVS